MHTDDGKSCVVSVDIGGTKIASCLVLPDGEKEFSLENLQQRATPASSGSEAMISAICGEVFALVSIAKKHQCKVQAIGLASAGVIDSNGCVTASTDLIRGWSGVPLKESVENRLGIRTFAINDVHAHALGECRYGAGRGGRRVVVITIGTGVGGALVVQGHVDRGEHGSSGHFGHFPHPLASGRSCSCGAVGHIEAVSSGPGQLSLYAERIGLNRLLDSGSELDRRALAGDPVARGVIQDTAFALGECAAGIANCVDPDRLVVSGSVTNIGEMWWDAFTGGYKGSAIATVRDIPCLRGKLGSRAALIGAALNVQNLEKSL